MRALLAFSVLALAAPAAAQPIQLQLDDLRAQQQAAERRAIDQANQMQALEARLRADQASADLAAQRAGARLPQLPYGDPSMTTRPAAATAAYPPAPAAVLAGSHRRVQDAARTRR